MGVITGAVDNGQNPLSQYTNSIGTGSNQLATSTANPYAVTDPSANSGGNYVYDPSTGNWTLGGVSNTTASPAASVLGGGSNANANSYWSQVNANPYGSIDTTPIGQSATQTANWVPFSSTTPSNTPVNLPAGSTPLTSTPAPNPNPTSTASNQYFNPLTQSNGATSTNSATTPPTTTTPTSNTGTTSNPSTTPTSTNNPLTPSYTFTSTGTYQQPLSNVIAGTGNETAPTFNTYMDQQQAAMNSPFMTPAAWAANIAEGAGGQPFLPSDYNSWTPAAQQAYQYAQVYPNAPEITQAGGVQQFINQYNSSQYSLSNLSPNAAQVSQATGYGTGTPGSYNNLVAQTLGATAPGTSYGNTSGYLGANVSNPTLPASQQVNTNYTGNNTAGANTTGGLTTAQLQQLYTALGGGGNSTPSTGITTTPLGYTQYTGQPSTSSSTDNSSLLAILAAILGSQQQTPTQTNYAGL